MSIYDLRRKKRSVGKSIFPPPGERGTKVKIAEALRLQIPGFQISGLHLNRGKIKPIPVGISYWFKRWDGRLRMLIRLNMGGLL